MPACRTLVLKISTVVHGNLHTTYAIQQGVKRWTLSAQSPHGSNASIRVGPVVIILAVQFLHVSPRFSDSPRFSTRLYAGSSACWMLHIPTSAQTHIITPNTPLTASPSRTIYLCSSAERGAWCISKTQQRKCSKISNN